MKAIFYAVISTFIVSLISLVGVIGLAFNKKILNKMLLILIGFAAGGLLGGTFFHLLPEALESMPSLNVFLLLILGYISFFILEKILHWRHCHEGECKIHPFGYLILVGDTLHNFIDGMIITASYLTSIKLGIITTLVVILHEIPQEIGDFSVLVYSGFSRTKALMFNFISALAAVLGAFVCYFILTFFSNFSILLLPLTGGGFIYIATSDLVPELHKEPDKMKSFIAFLSFLFGISLLLFFKIFFSHLH